MGKKHLYIFLAYLAIAYSAIHFFLGPVPQIAFILVVLVIHKKSPFLSKTLIKIILFVLLIILGQTLIFNKFSVYETISVIVSTILISFLLFQYLEISFPEFYVKALYYISIISLFFYASSMLIPGFHSFIRTIPVRFPFLDPQGRQFILHSVSHATDTLTGLYRHNGVFHEPGVFGLFLTIGLFFNYIVFKQVFNKYGIVFFVSVLTTFSTASFLALGILFLGFSYTAKRLKFLRYPVFVIIGGLFVYFFLNSNIMYEKIVFEYERDMAKSMEQTTAGRIYGARKSFNVMGKYPFTGRGLTPVTRVEDETSPEFIRYGILHEFAKVGIPAALLYLFFLIKGVKLYGRLYNEPRITNFFIAALLINLLAQSFAFTPVMMNFVLLGIFSKKYISTKV